MNKEDIQNKIDEIEKAMNEPDFWSDPKEAQAKLKKLEELKIELEGGDKFDSYDVIVNIFSGAGGDDAEDFTRILFEMYMKFCDQEGFSLVILDENKNSLNGYRNISFEINGKGVYKKMKTENGVHRLVRKSPFNSKGKRQTSFCMVEVLPKIEKKDFVLDENDLEISFTKSGGAGGQSVNKNETAVRVVHPKTGFSTLVSNERSQIQNREKAIEIIRAKVYKKHLEDEEKKAKGLTISDKVKIEWGSQRRSYIFDPYQVVKDHELEVDVNNIDKVLGGDLSFFYQAD